MRRLWFLGWQVLSLQGTDVEFSPFKRRADPPEDAVATELFGHPFLAPGLTILSTGCEIKRVVLNGHRVLDVLNPRKCIVPFCLSERELVQVELGPDMEAPCELYSARPGEPCGTGEGSTLQSDAGFAGGVLLPPVWGGSVPVGHEGGKER